MAKATASKSKPKKTAKPIAKRPAAQPKRTLASVLPPPQVIHKKRNVKRGAPPLLPRRMMRRPEPLQPGQSPPPLLPPKPTAPGVAPQHPVRAPEGAEALKQRLGTMASLITQLRGLKRSIVRQFFDVGLLLQRLADPALYKTKGYGSFDAFVEREIERDLGIGRSMVNDLIQIVQVFQRPTAEQLGLERLRDALRVLYPESGTGS